MKALPGLLFGLVLLSCNKAPEPEGSRPASTGSPAKTSAASSPSSPVSPVSPVELAWDAPPAFQKAENSSPMRKATYRIARAQGDAEDGELSVTQVGGTVDQNIKRWAGQFGQQLEGVKREARTVNGLKVTVVEIHGPYAGMAMPGAPAAAPKPGFALLGAIVETVPPTFFKLTGPEKTVTGARADFDRLVSSLRAK
jgi:hypothetical protein